MNGCCKNCAKGRALNGRSVYCGVTGAIEAELYSCREYCPQTNNLLTLAELVGLLTQMMRYFDLEIIGHGIRGQMIESSDRIKYSGFWEKFYKRKVENFRGVYLTDTSRYRVYISLADPER